MGQMMARIGQEEDPQKQTEAAKIKADWSRGSHIPSEAEITTAALLASEGHLTSVEKMLIEDISIIDIPRNHLEKLSMIVTEQVDIDGINHAEQLGSILSCIKVPYLWLGNMELSEAETLALTTAVPLLEHLHLSLALGRPRRIPHIRGKETREKEGKGLEFSPIL